MRAEPLIWTRLTLTLVFVCAVDRRRTALDRASARQRSRAGSRQRGLVENTVELFTRRVASSAGKDGLENLGGCFATAWQRRLTSGNGVTPSARGAAERSAAFFVTIPIVLRSRHQTIAPASEGGRYISEAAAYRSDDKSSSRRRADDAHDHAQSSHVSRVMPCN